MILFKQVHYGLIVQFVVLGTGLKLELTQLQKSGVVDMETHKFSVSVFRNFCSRN